MHRNEAYWKKILTEIDIVQVTKDTFILRKLMIDPSSKQELINEFINSTIVDETTASGQI